MTAEFLTLTYDTDHVPITANGFMSLEKRECQLFFKRLRKAQGKTEQPIKYFLVGEYGGKTKRPHYHVILFNAQRQYIDAAWQAGATWYGDRVGEASVGYMLKYMFKKGRIPMFDRDDRVPEFQLMSKGLGLNYLSPNAIKWHLNDLINRTHLVIEDGKKIAMPRYYKDKVYDEDQKELIGNSAQLLAIKSKQEYQEYMIKEYGENWENIHREAIARDFKKMYASAEKNRDKI